MDGNNPYPDRKAKSSSRGLRSGQSKAHSRSPALDKATTEPEYVDEIFPEEAESEFDPWEVEEEPQQDFTPDREEDEQTSDPDPDRKESPFAPGSAFHKRIRAPKRRPAPRPLPSRGAQFSISVRRNGVAMPTKAQIPAKRPRPVAQTPSHPSQSPAGDQRTGVSSQPRQQPSEDAQEKDAVVAQGKKTESSTQNKHSLAAVIATNQPLPLPSIILGVCEDGLPLLVDLSDPTPGSILVMGDEVAGNRQQLRAILISAARLNQANNVRVDVISTHPQDFSTESKSRSAQVPSAGKTFELLSELYALAEARVTKGTGKTPVRLIAIDELDILLAQLDEQSQSYFRWLIRRGPEVGVWIVATIGAKQTGPPTWKTLRAFGTVLASKVADAKVSKAFVHVPPRTLETLQPGRESSLRLGDEIVRFSVLAE